MQNSKKIRIIPYNPAWPLEYEQASKIIEIALGSNCLKNHHIGSTSVPNLASKPKIDIIAEVVSGRATILPLEKAGFAYRGEWNIPFKYGFTCRGDIDINLHVLENNHPEIESNILFRDYLRGNDDKREEYERLKYSLAEDKLARQKHLFLYNYTIKKSQFIKDVLKKAGFKRLRITRCIDESELAKAKEYRQGYYSRKKAKDSYLLTFNSEDHRHFMLYQGVEIIGYIHIKFISDKEAIIEILKLEKKEFENEFIALVRKWLETYNYNLAL